MQEKIDNASQCAKEVGVEIHSLSKTYNMTGWRVAFIADGIEQEQKIMKDFKQRLSDIEFEF